MGGMGKHVSREEDGMLRPSTGYSKSAFRVLVATGIQPKSAR